MDKAMHKNFYHFVYISIIFSSTISDNIRIYNCSSVDNVTTWNRDFKHQNFCFFGKKFLLSYFAFELK